MMINKIDKEFVREKNEIVTEEIKTYYFFTFSYIKRRKYWFRTNF